MPDYHIVPYRGMPGCLTLQDTAKDAKDASSCSCQLILKDFPPQTSPSLTTILGHRVFFVLRGVVCLFVLPLCNLEDLIFPLAPSLKGPPPSLFSL